MPEGRKCVVWDLDQTLWDGVALEGEVRVKPEARRTVEVLDRRGILHSIASRGDEDLAVRILRENGLEAYFLSPKINWLAKSGNIVAVSKELGIPLEAMAFIDDDPFEREQVAFMLPQVLVIDAAKAAALPDMPEFSPGALTAEAGSRRLFYQAEQERKRASSRFRTREEFLRSCAMRLKVRSMTEADIPRVKELATRTHQLNTTGCTFGEEELLDVVRLGGKLRAGRVAELTDKYGSYGIIGVAFIDRRNGSWRLEYLAMSCRILGRGVERAFLIELLGFARECGVGQAEALFKDTGRNKMMRALYQMMGFRASGPGGDGEATIFRAAVDEPLQSPDWVTIL